MKEVFEFAVQLADRAGKNTLQYFGGDLSVERKDDNSPVTIADRSTEELIRSEIEKRFPDDGLLGEEFGETPSKNGYRWVIDPIDGTKTFIRGVPLYGTLIAREKDGESEIGVAAFPPLGILLSAMKGEGCFVNGTRCRVSNTPALEQASFMFTDPSDIVRFYGEKTFLRLLSKTALQRTWADCYGYYLVATGHADFMLDAQMKRWDIAPMNPIILEAGGMVTDTEGNTSNTNRNLIASNGLFHRQILDLLQEK